MSALFAFGAGIAVMALVWFVVDLIADRIKEAREAVGGFPAEQMESITVQALRLMLLEAFKAQQQISELRRQ